jgi:hypothetical protein
MKKEVWACAFFVATASPFASKFRVEVFVYFHAVAIKLHSNIRTWLIDLPWQILYKQTPLCQRKWWAFSCLYSSPVSPLSVCPEPSMPFRHPSTAHAFSVERLSNHCQRLRSTFSDFLHKILFTLAVSFIAKLRQARYTTPNKRTTQIRTSTELREILYTDFQDMLVLSSIVALRYYKCCTDGSTSAGNYGWHLTIYRSSHLCGLIFRCRRNLCMKITFEFSPESFEVKRIPHTLKRRNGSM